MSRQSSRTGVLITGGSGFLGQEVIKRLTGEDVRITGLARSDSSAQTLRNLGVEPVLGSLDNIREWASALDGRDVVVHCAAPVEFWGKWEKFEKGILNATKELYRASEERGVKRFIYVSSESVLQDKKDLVDVDETEPYPKEPNSYYGKAKMLAEQFIAAQKGPMESIIFRPPFIWGKGVKALDAIEEKIRSKDFMWVDHGRALFEMVHVKNVAEAVYLAIQSGAEHHGEIFFVTDDNPQPVRDFLTKLLATRGIAPPDKNIPKRAATALAGVVETIWKAFGRTSSPPITRFDVAFVAMSRKYNISKIKKALNYHPVVSEQEGLQEMRETP